MRILILGGTTEARQLAERLADRCGVAVILALAGRTLAPVNIPVPLRIGGFGGAQGLANHLTGERVDVLVDATHPFAVNISHNAIEAARLANVPLLVLRRAPWVARDGDRWLEVDNLTQAARVLGMLPRRVFVASGRKDLLPLVAAPQHHYVIRSIDPIEPPLPLPHAEYLTMRGPFREEDERVLLATLGIDVVVSKNSGGAAAYGKIAAARQLAISVVMLRRPPAPAETVATVATVDTALSWLAHAGLPGAARGV
jgi:precorrin-6A/cobalt-precorrin-6A reductase